MTRIDATVESADKALNMEPVSHRLKRAAELTGVSADTLEKMISTGQLKAKRFSSNGGRYYTVVPHSELVRVFGV